MSIGVPSSFGVVHYVLQAGRIEVARAGTHHYALKRRYAHRRIHALAVHDRRQAGAVAQMAHDYARALGAAQQLAATPRHESVAGAVEAVAPHLQLAVVLHRQRVQIRLGRHRLMESGVEHRDHGRGGHDLLARLYALQVCGVVQRAQRYVLAYRGLDVVVYQHGLGVLFAAVQHAVAHRAYLVHRLDRALFGIGQRLDDVVHRVDVIGHCGIELYLLVADLLLEVGAGYAYALGQALGYDLFIVHVYQLVLERRRAGVDYQYLHAASSFDDRRGAWPRTEVRRAGEPARPARPDGYLYQHSCACTAVTAMVATMSSALQPRLRSLTGFARPCIIGPYASAPARRCTSL